MPIYKGYFIGEIMDLQDKVVSKEKLEMGDTEALEYIALQQKFIERFMPKDGQEFVEYCIQMAKEYDERLNHIIEAMERDHKDEVDILEGRLNQIAHAIKPYMKDE